MSFGTYTYEFLLGLYLGVESLHHSVHVCVTSEDTTSFPNSLYQFTLQPTIVESSGPPHSLQHLILPIC